MVAAGDWLCEKEGKGDEGSYACAPEDNLFFLMQMGWWVS